jgi:thiol:disulfide interchange protein
MRGFAVMLVAFSAVGCSEGRGSPADYEVARKKARDEGKQIFVEFSASWCSPCQKMKQTTFTDPLVRDKLSRYVEVLLDADSNSELASKFGVRGIPAYLVLSAEGTVILRGSGFRGPQAFRQWLDGGG